MAWQQSGIAILPCAVGIMAVHGSCKRCDTFLDSNKREVPGPVTLCRACGCGAELTDQAAADRASTPASLPSQLSQGVNSEHTTGARIKTACDPRGVKGQHRAGVFKSSSAFSARALISLLPRSWGLS